MSSLSQLIAEADNDGTLWIGSAELARARVSCVLPAAVLAAPPAGALQPSHPASSETIQTTYGHQQVGEVSVFYREAGPPGAPVILLLHGFPTAGHMFRDLIPALADRYRVIAPDLPGFGNTRRALLLVVRI